MISNASHLLYKAPILGMVDRKMTGPGGTSYGLGEAGYDIRIAETVEFRKFLWFIPLHRVNHGKWKLGSFCLASAMEKFDTPTDLIGIVHDKSTWARRGLSVFNTVIESGWRGYLTLELVHHGRKHIVIPSGAGIAQVVYHQTQQQTQYNSKYQDQEAGPQEARDS